jgi:NtrC-family two-component system response regulator AlgB
MAASANPEFVLVVDDDACFRKSMAIALRLEGLQVAEASSLSEALAQLRAHRIVLAVVDLLLGSERGDDVLEQIARLSPETRLAALSGHPDLESRWAKKGKVVQLHKPVRPQELLGLLAAG